MYRLATADNTQEGRLICVKVCEGAQFLKGNIHHSVIHVKRPCNP